MHSETIGERIRHLAGDLADSPHVPRWPPDVFAICASLLLCSGCYSLLVDDKPLHGKPPQSDLRAQEIEKLGEEWRTVAVSSKRMPDSLQRLWTVIYDNKTAQIAKLAKNRVVAIALMDLLAAADASSYDVGIFFPSTSPSDSTSNSEYVMRAERRLLDTLSDDQGSTLCHNIHQSKGRVLPKMHTPQSGLTVRSLSHHLAYCTSPDVSPKWLSAGVEADDHVFNLLVVPWPYVINPTQFRSTRKVGITDQVEGGSYGLFTYLAPDGPSDSLIERLISDAEVRIGQVHGIVFPELSMSGAEFERIAEKIGEDRFLVAGIGKEAQGAYHAGTNEAIIQVRLPLSIRNVFTRFHQRKHHRWKITKSQILQYGIGQNLHPGVNWWEHILLGDRSLTFVTLRPWLTTSVLICEDLARPDPMGDILRSVGPNLIIALLCDAPQLLSRWPGRYAGAFADDPGSSVLTVTSAGMAAMSQPQPGRTNRSKTIALWRDARSGAQEIELAPDAAAVLLNLTVEYDEEWTADGRGDGGTSGYPVLAAYHPIFDQDAQTSRDGKATRSKVKSSKRISKSKLAVARTIS